MSEPEKKRRFFQFHLSTALVLMLIAAILFSIDFRKHETSDTAAELEWTYGWPLVAYQGVRDYVVSDEMETAFLYSGGGQLRPLRPGKSSPPPRQPIPIQVPKIRQEIIPTWNRTGFAIDLFVAIVVLLAVAVASEWLIRRREGRKP